MAAAMAMAHGTLIRAVCRWRKRRRFPGKGPGSAIGACVVARIPDLPGRAVDFTRPFAGVHGKLRLAVTAVKQAQVGLLDTIDCAYVDGTLGDMERLVAGCAGCHAR